VLSLAQQTQPQTAPQRMPWDWTCPWHMGHGGWGFWWVFPLGMLFMSVARGEIDTREYLEKRTTLTSSDGGAGGFGRPGR